MSRHFSAVLLLDWVSPFDIQALANAVQSHFPGIGCVDAVRGQSDGMASGLLRIDGGHVVATLTDHPFPVEQLSPRLQVLRSWKPERAIARQQGYLTLSCGGGLEGLEGAEAYAAAVHFVAAAATRMLPVTGVFWQRGFSLCDPIDFYDSCGALLRGRMPLGAWVSFASIVPKGYVPECATGMVTYGMRPFIGREIELAPRPCTPRVAHDCLSAVARKALDQGVRLVDGQRCVIGGDAGFAVTVKARTYWLRRDQSAFVLVADDSVVEADTLRPRQLPAA